MWWSKRARGRKRKRGKGRRGREYKVGNHREDRNVTMYPKSQWKVSALHRYSDLNKDQFGGNVVALKKIKWLEFFHFAMYWMKINEKFLWNKCKDNKV